MADGKQFKNEKCVFCGHDIKENDVDGDGAFINYEARIGFVGRVITAFYTDYDPIDVDDWETATEHGFFHIDCFIEHVRKINNG